MDTLTVAGGAITSMTYGNGGPGSVPAGGTTAAASAFLSMPSGGTGVVLSGYCTLTGQSGDCSGYVGIAKNGVTIAEYGVFVPGNTWFSYSICVYDPAPGSATYQLMLRSPTSGPGANRPIGFTSAAITATGGKR